MKLELLKPNHVIEAAKLIDEQGIPKDHVSSQYYVVVNGKEYPFKYLVRTAFSLVSDEKLQFQSNDSYRNYIKNLGFDTTYYEGGYNFFTKEELEFYSSIVNTDYRTSNKEQQLYGQKLYPIIAKAKYWAEQLLFDDFKLRKDGNWLNGHVARIKPYFWPRIYKDEDKDIFFNVEVNGSERFIGYKLDGYYETTKALPDYKIKILNEFKNLINWEWPRIPFDELEAYDWERLLKESRDYIKKYLSHHDNLKKLLSKETKIARITWNTNKWIKPSGRNGKSTNPSFEFEHGFGHEEWLFDGDKAIDGFKFGFLEPIHKYRSKYEGKIFDISLYTRDSESNQSFWVTTLKNVEVLMSKESDVVLSHYQEEGWYDGMKADLFNLNLDSKQLDEWIKEDSSLLFNVKFEAVQISEIPQEITPILDEKDIPSNRYTLMDIPYEVQKKYEEKNKTGFSFENSGSTDADLTSGGIRKGTGREVELDYKHNDLQKFFLKYLKKSYGEAVAKRECTAYGSSRIDITRKTETGYIFYEIKTYNSLRASIREGIGQLLEYCLYPNVQEAEKLVLVSHVEPSNELIGYLNHIKEFINIPFSYIHFDTEKEEVISEI
ncbi:hypothetical protein AQPE_0200 [Aquipluma nitroreducens]|uniref:Uncharacterized protein n=1 Tax=Aquipluma nitroreducens TaxID=2010828 RepID=A0A5K7S3E3_9BACT|nr:hypothetical protein [Aquipluma nitroreducens]BBE16063.1 hypothetical protein AQPE_0200 [Aquipluma nitroreducens]